MKWFKNWLEERKRRKNERLVKQAVCKSEELFTIKELDGHLWLACDGICILPCKLFDAKSEEDIIKLLNDVRGFYVTNMTNHD